MNAEQQSEPLEILRCGVGTATGRDTRAPALINKPYSLSTKR